MKEIKAIIQPFRIDAVIDALRQHPELPGVTISEVMGFGKQQAVGTPDAQRVYLGTQAFAKKAKLEIVVDDSVVDAVVDLIASAAHTGNPGDGVVFVSDVQTKRRIREARSTGAT
jgi:nitrogen regulatory protein P-II 1